MVNALYAMLMTCVTASPQERMQIILNKLARTHDCRLVISTEKRRIEVRKEGGIGDGYGGWGCENLKTLPYHRVVEDIGDTWKVKQVRPELDYLPQKLQVHVQLDMYDTHH